MELYKDPNCRYYSNDKTGFSEKFYGLKDLIETTDVKIRQDLQKLLKKYTWPVMFGKTINSEEFLKNLD